MTEKSYHGIPVVDEYRYLGVTISRNGKIGLHLELLENRCRYLLYK